MTYSTRIRLVGALPALFILAGCTGPSGSTPATSAVAPAAHAVTQTAPAARISVLLPVPAPHEAVPATADSSFARCRRELGSLKLISPAAWDRRRAEFDRLVSRAAVYAQVRSNISDQTQDAVDALYQYQTRQLCIRIQRDVVDGLLLRAGSGGEGG